MATNIVNPVTVPVNEIISRDAARERGLKFYYTGKPCKHGHICKIWTANHWCWECYNIAAIKKQKPKQLYEIPEKFKDVPILSRSEAKGIGLIHYFNGRPCKFGHFEYRRVDIAACPQCGREKAIEYHYKNRDRTLEKLRNRWKGLRGEKQRQLARDYYKKNKDKVIKRSIEKYKEKWKNPTFRLNRRMSAGINHSLKKRNTSKRGCSWMKLIDYTLNELSTHIERQFTKGMNWNNMGRWEIDHIIPISSFQFKDADDPEFKAAWALTNLRPLWQQENASKKDKRLFLL